MFPWQLQTIHLSFSFCTATQWMLLESRGIGLTVLCAVLPLQQPTDAGEGRCVLVKHGIQGE